MPLPDELPVEVILKPAKNQIVKELAEKSLRKKVAVKLPDDILPKTARNALYTHNLTRKVKLRKYRNAYYLAPLG